MNATCGPARHVAAWRNILLAAIGQDGRGFVGEDDFRDPRVALQFTDVPFPIELLPNPSAVKRVITFFSHFDSMVVLSDTAYAEVGRGSLGVAGSLVYNAQ